MKRYLIPLLIIIMMITSCTKKDNNTITSDPGSITTNTEETSETTTYKNNKPYLLSEFMDVKKSEYTPSIPDYKIENNFSNVLNYEHISHLNSDALEKLEKNNFVLIEGYENEFFDIYQMNTYMYFPNYITTDSLLHTFHLYYAHLQKNIEKNYLKDMLLQMANDLLKETINQEEALKDSEWENAVNRNKDFISIGINLLGEEAPLSENGQKELDFINKADGIEVSPLFSTVERKYLQDYSQFIVRGYYTEDENLSKFFKAMMWFGQMNFSNNSEELNKSALLLVSALNEKNILENFATIYKVTSFFSGESDDNSYYEYYPILKEIYGEITMDNIKNNKENFEKYVDKIKKLPLPLINSMVVSEKENKEEVTSGYRLMGQRFTIDAKIFQTLIYRNVLENKNDQKRMLPDPLDVPAALGSLEALKILEEKEETSYKNYIENMEKLKAAYINDKPEIWHASIYSGWLNTLRPLLITKKEGYPIFMQSELWDRKNLISFLGSYSELKHDSILYSKQTMAQLGGMGLENPPDDRGYVETEPEVFASLKALANATTKGLQHLKMISDEDVKYMQLLEEIAGKLEIMAIKELNNELLSDEEYDFIKSYGGQLEHLWIKTVKKDGYEGNYKSVDFPAPIIADIATDPNSNKCLEVATGNPNIILVAVYFDDQVRIARGASFSFYTFHQPINERLTDEIWRGMLEQGSNYETGSENKTKQPYWTEAFLTQK